MKITNLLIALVLLAYASCSSGTRVTLGGPSVSDQMKSRGYIATRADTVPPDTSGTAPDTLR